MLDDLPPPQPIGIESLAGAVVGDYTIGEPIGEGGMGVVYAAQQTQPVRRQVALKIIRAGLANQEMLARFQAERQALAMMDHPHIAKVLEVGTTPSGQPYLVMELLQGQKITDYADTHQLNTVERLRIFKLVCHAVQHAHRKGIIHRDLKPSNILVEQIDGTAVPKVIDFGLAKAVDVALTDATLVGDTSRTLGTPRYMSPEQAEPGSLDIDTRSDVYSLGVVLYELLTGSLPFERSALRSAGPDELRRLIREAEPRKPSAVTPVTTQAGTAPTVSETHPAQARRQPSQLSGELDWIVLKALEKDRERRYQSASDLAADLRRYLNHEAVHACPPSKLYRCKKYIRRHRVGAGIATLLAVCLLAVGVMTTWQVVQVQRARQESEWRAQMASDLLEAVRLKTAVALLSQRNLSGLRDEIEQWPRRTLSRHPRDGSPTDLPPASLVTLLRSAAYPAPLRSLRHIQPIHGLAATEDGQIAVTVDAAGDVTQWNLASTTPEPQRLGSHGEQADSVAISPDGKQAVTGSQHGKLMFWDLHSGELLRTIEQHSSGVESLRWSPDGNYLAAGARYSGVWVYNSDGSLRLKIDNDHRHESLLFSADSRELFVPTRQGIEVWDMDTNRQARSIDTSPLVNVRAICFAGPDQRWLVGGERFSDLLFAWDPQTGERGGQMVAAEYARSLAASPDGKWLAASYTDGRVQVLELDCRYDDQITGKLHHQFRAHRKALDHRQPIVWLPENELLSAASDGDLHHWRLDEVQPWHTITPPGHLHLTLLCPDHTQPMFFFFDHLRDIPWAKQFNGGKCFPYGTVSRDITNGMVALAHENTHISIAECRTGRVLGRIKTPFKPCHGTVFSSDGRRLIAYNQEQLCVWHSDDRWATHTLLRSIKVPQINPPTLTDQGQTIIVDEAEHECLMEIDVASGEVLAKYPDPSDSAYCVSHDGILLAEAAHHGIRVRNRKTGARLLEQSVDSQPRALQFLPDDRVLLALHNDGRLTAWHIPTRQALGTLFVPAEVPGDPIHLQIAAGGRRVVMNYHSHQTRIPIVLGRP
ncbi:serine/threonine-protein kinase [Roseimaritima ulvae]|uniref:Serine/threonine-protein kinase PknB n=1 Tax=Roseimaritima ulvae TaxID=980254 RepID=A0A5B9QLI2_9BACT|nr:serine/threonine-protein kinase [Roseimaritima ulvae]QEG38879.1 Serine/threonine-protein kinase PknB [Roseimaritima ulvae]